MTKKNLSAMPEMQVLSMGGEGPLEKRMATHSSTLAGELHEQKRATVHGVTKSQIQLSN